MMQLKNIVAVVLKIEKVPAGKKISVGSVIKDPLVPEKDGQPIIGPYLRRLMSIKEIVREKGYSRNKASTRRANLIAQKSPLIVEFLKDFPGQPPLEL